MARRDLMFTEQKRILKTVKEEYQDKFKALEEKYASQKAIILRLEEEILELRKNSMAVNVGRTISPDSEKTGTAKLNQLQISNNNFSFSFCRYGRIIRTYI